ncbi:aminoglycoside phosphotransferase family protein [Actinotalea ferrariae]|uniref:aminoglycoside phosphotransferase family protein n=1 Tax=Actinotalea ferrariae TaxID=1386098 RepID=UPI001C8B6CD8|nr:aminoglycoside phosphotransferase family protein [Actinotalea ferrariae]MBX9243477.1 aminoglycoside phosphotransferase family protein [Actinotalea ferrariae]
MDPPDLARAIDAATAVALSLDLPGSDATVLHNSNRLALHLEPCGVLARVAHVGNEVAQLEVDVARQLADLGAPVGALEPRVDPLVYTRDGFAVTLWVYYRPATPAAAPADYVRALERLHLEMRGAEGIFPRFTERIAAAERIVAEPDSSPDLPEAERVFLGSRLRWLREAIGKSGREQLLHGEPHPGNILPTDDGPLFIDFETCCTGPVEFDLAHVPGDVAERYRGVDHQLLDHCRELVLAMVAAWRWEEGDKFPNGLRFREEFLRLLHGGPPWPTLDAVTKRLGP